MQTTGTRVPTFGFLTGGTGQSNLGLPPQEYETFAYDSALRAAGIENFNVVPYTSVLPKELRGNIITDVTNVQSFFHHGSVLEVIMAGSGAAKSRFAALATGLGLCWAETRHGKFIGGFAAEFIQRYTSQIDADVAQTEAQLWLTKSMDHELKLRGLRKVGDYEFFVNWMNIEERYGYCLTALGFLNFKWTKPVDPKAILPPQ